MEFGFGFLIFTAVTFLIVGFALGDMTEVYIQERRERKASAENAKPSVDLYATMESALKTVEEGWIQLYPPHPETCDCAYCEIKFGVGKLRNVPPTSPAQPYHPQFVREVVQKNKSLQKEVKDLRAELERRDRQNALEYQKIAPRYVGPSTAGFRV